MLKTFLKMMPIAAFIISILTSGVGAEEIIAVHGEQVSALRGEICWFVRGVNESVLLCDDNEPDQLFYITTEAMGHKTAVSFSVPETPVVVENIQVLICNADMFPELPGNSYSPFKLNISANNGGYPGAVLVDNQTIAAGDQWSYNGQWVPLQADFLLHHDSIFWGVFSWLPETPAAPILAVDYDVGSYHTVIGYDSDGMVWEYYQTGNVMMRSEILRNDKEGIFSIAEDVTVPDSFRIYFSGQQVVYPAEIYYDTTVIGKLHSRVVLPGPENYFCVTSFENNQESPASRIVNIHGSSASTADLDFHPNYYDLILPCQRDTSVYLVIENDEDEAINFRIADIDIEEISLGGTVGLGVIPSEGVIPAGQEISVRIDLSTADVIPDLYQIELTFEIWDINKGYRDKYIPIDLQVSEFTSTENYDDNKPEAFSLGQNYPNPFNSRTVIPYNAGTDDEITFEIFDLLGRRVYHQKNVEPNFNYFIWEGKDNHGNDLPSGLYFYQISNSTLRKARKMIYLK